MALAPPVNDVERSVHVVATGEALVLRIWQTFTAPIDCDGSKRLKEGTRPGSCVTVIVCPPTVTVPERDDPVLASAVTVSVPLLVVVVLGTERNEALLVAVHEQVGVLAVTANATVPPPALALAVVG